MYTPKLFLKLGDDESRYLNELGAFFFGELLVECILFYFRETEATVDFLYAENRWDQDGAFLFKKLYHWAKAEARLRSPGLLQRHLEHLQSIGLLERYQGHDLRQLLEEGLVEFKSTGVGGCALCGTTQPFCGQTGERHQSDAAIGANGHDLDPFLGHRRALQDTSRSHLWASLRRPARVPCQAQ